MFSLKTFKFVMASASVLALAACQQSTQTDADAPQEQNVAATSETDMKPSDMASSTQSPTVTSGATSDEAHLWLEDVTGDAALTKVKSWNAASAVKMETPTYETMKAELLEVYNSPEKIPYISYRNGEAHNFWQDDVHVKGIWRKTDLASYKSDTPDWETVLDVDAIAASEDKNWVYKGNTCHAPDYDRCIVNLSIGGKDAVERREFNAATGEFVDGGFFTPESKGGAAWLNDDTLLIGVDFGEGTMTDSGYPMQARLWKRGQDLSDATILMQGEPADVGVWSGTFENADGDNEIMIVRATTFYDTEYYWVPQDTLEPVKLPLPAKSNLADQFKGQQLVTLQEDWRGHASGTLVSFSIADFMQNGEISEVNAVMTPGPRQSIENFGATQSKVLLSLFDNVTGSAYALDFIDGVWTSQKMDFRENGTVSIGSTSTKEDIAFINTESFLDPDTLWMVDTSDLSVSKLRSLPSWFDAETMTATQKFVASSDGVEIPYFVVHKKDIQMDGKNPTLLYGYGGFEISLKPSYSATIGRAWLENGGVYVVANTRGGGEFGPNWHQAGLKTKRQIIYDDFIAVAEDLIDSGITSPEHLGTHGRSNGGLLMGVMFTQRPDLFNAVAIGVPLLDMQRYHKLLAGASWVGEYGNPDDTGEEGAFIRALSPYHNIKSDVEYPEPYIYTSTKDDRVHPAHARKFAQRLEDMGYDFLYYENIDGGHAGAANLEETAHSQALIYSYFDSKLKP